MKIRPLVIVITLHALPLGLAHAGTEQIITGQIRANAGAARAIASELHASRYPASVVKRPLTTQARSSVAVGARAQLGASSVFTESPSSTSGTQPGRLVLQGMPSSTVRGVVTASASERGVYVRGEDVTAADKNNSASLAKDQRVHWEGFTSSRGTTTTSRFDGVRPDYGVGRGPSFSMPVAGRGSIRTVGEIDRPAVHDDNTPAKSFIVTSLRGVTHATIDTELTAASNPTSARVYLLTPDAAKPGSFKPTKIAEGDARPVLAETNPGMRAAKWNIARQTAILAARSLPPSLAQAAQKLYDGAVKQFPLATLAMGETANATGVTDESNPRSTTSLAAAPVSRVPDYLDGLKAGVHEYATRMNVDGKERGVFISGHDVRTVVDTGGSRHFSRVASPIPPGLPFRGAALPAGSHLVDSFSSTHGAKPRRTYLVRPDAEAKGGFRAIGLTATEAADLHASKPADSYVIDADGVARQNSAPGYELESLKGNGFQPQ